ncbi:hypothetical protein [Acinetobacter soli]|uniref:hypothetical protein n=1 Tax=Acinetobacter soli TaxID=487316 RepID=UPI001F3BAE06|nr:hypothetical protein [Acinetobacter soli]MCE6007561.1 hypothetical protein [Acinetobacter soli]
MNENTPEDDHKSTTLFFGIPKVEEPKYSEIRVAQRQKNKISEIFIYIGLYLLAYVFILAVCGGFQYFTECQNRSFTCSFDVTSFNTIITTTSYVLTPIVAIIGFLSWKRQHNKQTISQLSKEAYEYLSSQNLIAFNYSKYISSSYIGEVVNDQIRSDLINTTNKTFDLIRLICKITNNTKLETLNEQNRTAITALVINFDMRFEDGAQEDDSRRKFNSDYQVYADFMKQIREELSDYILI